MGDEVLAMGAAALASALREMRRAAGQPSLREIADETDLSHSTVADYLNGQRLPRRWEVVERFVRALHGDPETARSLWDSIPRAATPSERAVRVHYTRDGRTFFASGVRVAERYVLTDQSCATGTAHTVTVGKREYRADLVDAGGTADLGLAVLIVPELNPVLPLPVAGMSGDQRQLDESQIFGFPEWRAGGRIHVLGRLRANPTGSGLMSFEASRSFPWPKPETGANPWTGVSGAAVLATEGTLFGVVSRLPAEGGALLGVTPITAIDQLPAGTAATIWSAFGAAGSASLATAPRIEKHRPAQIVAGNLPAEPMGFIDTTTSARVRELLDRSPHAGVCVLTGMGGVGKTQLAAAYARQLIATGIDVAGWVDAESAETTMAGMATIAERLGVADPGGDNAASALRLRDHLRGQSEPALLVFDNAADADLVRGLLPAAGRCRVLITSRNRSFAALGDTIEVTGFSRDEAVRYLGDATELADHAGATGLAAELGDLPLALSAAAATIRGRRIDYRTYRRLLRQRPLPNALARKPGHDYPRSVDQAIMMSIDLAEAPTDDVQLDTEVVRLLGVLAMLAPGGVRRAILPDPEERVDEALERCVAGSLLSWSTTGDTVFMHPLVARVLRERAESANAQTDLVHAALNVIEPQLFDQPQAWSRRAEGSQLVEHIEALWRTGLVGHSDHRAQRRMFAARNWAVSQLIAAAETSSSIALGQQTRTDSEQFFGPGHHLTLTARNNLAGAYESAGRIEEAIDLYSETLTAREHLLGPDHPDTLTARNNLAYTYRSIGRLEEAIVLYEANLIDSERILGPDHPHTLTARNNLAYTYRSIGRLEEAIVLYEANLIDSERILGADSPDTLTARNNLAYTYEAAGRTAESIVMQQALLADSERLLGPDHPYTLTARNNLASAYASTGRAAEALALSETTLADRERVLGPDHPDTLAARNNLACTYEAAGRVTDAITLLEATFAGSTRHLGTEHPLTETVGANLARLHRNRRAE